MNKVLVTNKCMKITDTNHYPLLINKEVSQALKEKGINNTLPNAEIDLSGGLLWNNGTVHSNRLAFLGGVGCRNITNIKLNTNQKDVFAKMYLIKESYLIPETKNETRPPRN